MPDSNEGTPDEEDTADIAAAWQSLFDARQKRRTVHDLVRRLREQRTGGDDFDTRWADITGRDAT